MNPKEMTRPGAETFDPIAEEYDFLASLDRSKNDAFLENLPANRASALDIGCGSGVLAAELSEHFEEVVGLDVSSEMLAIGRVKRSLPSVTYVRMDAAHIAFKRRFDFVCSANTYHHLKELAPALEAATRLVAPGGRLAILDNVSDVETPATWVYVLGALLEFLPDCRRHGARKAIRAFRCKTSRPWLGHLAGDKYLSQDGFRRVYGSVLADCTFERRGPFMLALWDA